MKDPFDSRFPDIKTMPVHTKTAMHLKDGMSRGEEKKPFGSETERETCRLRVRGSEIVIFNPRVPKSERTRGRETIESRADPRGRCQLKVGASARRRVRSAATFATKSARSNDGAAKRESRRYEPSLARTRNSPIIDRGRRTAAPGKSGNRVASRRTACTLGARRFPWNVLVEPRTQSQYGRRTSAVFTSLPTYLRDERERKFLPAPPPA